TPHTAHALARLHLAGGDAAAAEQSLTPFPPVLGTVRQRVDGDILRTLIAAGRDQGAALQLLEDALLASAPLGLARRGPDRARTRRPALPREHPVQRRDRRAAVPVGQHRENPPAHDLPQTRRRRSTRRRPTSQTTPAPLTGVAPDTASPHRNDPRSPRSPRSSLPRGPMPRGREATEMLQTPSSKIAVPALP